MTRTFVATFFDLVGNKVEKETTIGFHCDDNPQCKKYNKKECVRPAACDGKCVDLADSNFNCGGCDNHCSSAFTECIESYCIFTSELHNPFIQAQILLS